MICLTRSKSPIAGFGLLTLLMPLICGCVVNGQARSKTEETTSVPRLVTYRCDGDTQMTVENGRGKVHVLSPRGLDVELPASPPTQASRYGDAPYALVMERDEALWMVTGKMPLNCRRGAAKQKTASID